MFGAGRCSFASYRVEENAIRTAELFVDRQHICYFLLENRKWVDPYDIGTKLCRAITCHVCLGLGLALGGRVEGTCGGGGGGWCPLINRVLYLSMILHSRY